MTQHQYFLIQKEPSCLVRFSRGWMKDSPKQMGSLCTRSAEPVSPPFGQRNCPEMDSCAQGRAYRKWNHTQCLWLPRGLATHWPGHPAADRQIVSCPKFFRRSATIHHSFRLWDKFKSIVLFNRTALLVSHFLCWPYGLGIPMYCTISEKNDEHKH